MTLPRQIATWAVAASLSLLLLISAAVWQSRQVGRRLAVQVAAQPAAGSVLFRRKGCAACHGPTGAGTDFGPALRQSRALSSLPQLVSAMWNHAPHMWQAMEARQLAYPTFTYEETAQLVTYLYMSGYADNGGDPARGEKLFQQLKCAQCHAEGGVKSKAPSVGSIAVSDDPLMWTQALWNHASAMQAQMNSMGFAWPKFQPSDLRDLHAYLRQKRNSPAADPPDVAGDPDRGWNLFQQKGCIHCHAVSPEAGSLGPSLGPERQLPPTFSEFGAALLNHFPAMQTAMQAERAQLPRFQDHDMTDLAVFLYSLHYLEPTGSSQVGKSVFAWRGCGRCHGDNAEGTSQGPALRGRGQTYTAVRMATDLWRHGGRMYQDGRQSGQAWPTLEDSDIGHILTFLNTSEP